MKNTLLTGCFLLSYFFGHSQVKDTFEVYFPFNVPALDKDMQTYIDGLVFKDKLIPGDKLIVLGYTDFVGGNSYNDTLSMHRAKNVRDYLTKSGFAEKDIKLCVGKGKIDRTNVTGNNGYAPDRKVQIIIDREEMARSRPPVVISENPPAKKPGENDELDNVKVNETFALNNIFFKLNQPVLLPESEPDLQRLLEFLKRNQSVHIQVEGHVCCMGSTEGVDSKYKGRNLSECRAEAINNYLVEKGIDKDRIKYIGLGNNNPVVRNEVTQADKQKNRRVEIRILSK